MTRKFDIPQELYDRALAAAESRGVTPRRFLLDAILEAVEDVEDYQTAERAMARIESGEDQMYTLDELEALIGMEGDHQRTGEEAAAEAAGDRSREDPDISARRRKTG